MKKLLVTLAALTMAAAPVQATPQRVWEGNDRAMLGEECATSMEAYIDNLAYVARTIPYIRPDDKDTLKAIFAPGIKARKATNEYCPGDFISYFNEGVRRDLDDDLKFLVDTYTRAAS